MIERLKDCSRRRICSAIIIVQYNGKKLTEQKFFIVFLTVTLFSLDLHVENVELISETGQTIFTVLTGSCDWSFLKLRPVIGQFLRILLYDWWKVTLSCCQGILDLILKWKLCYAIIRKTKTWSILQTRWPIIMFSNFPFMENIKWIMINYEWYLH